MTTLDAAKQLLDAIDNHYIDEPEVSAALLSMREAIAREEAQTVESLKATPADMAIYRSIAEAVAQTVEPVAWQARIHDAGGWREWSEIVSDGRKTPNEILDNYRIDIAAGFSNIEIRPVFTHPAPSQAVSVT